MADYIVRAAAETDADTIKRIVRSNPLDPNAVDWHYFTVLEVIENGQPKIASIGMAHPSGEGQERVMEIDSVATLPEYQKHGYAEAVVHTLIEHHPEPLYLLAEDKLVAYYEKFGFRVMTDDAPHTMIEQRDWVNDFMHGSRVYHVMGKTK